MVEVRVNLDSWREFAARPGNDTKNGNVVFLLSCLEEAYETMDMTIERLEMMIDSSPKKRKRNARLQRIANGLKEWGDV